jgi:hypothetical protein
VIVWPLAAAARDAILFVGSMALGGQSMKLVPLYVLRYHYPEGWAVPIGGSGSKEEQHFYFAEGECKGALQGRFRAANHPRRRSDGPFLLDMQGFIETSDGAIIMTDFQGYGRDYPVGRRQVVGTVRHITDHPTYTRLNDCICVLSGEVRVPEHPEPTEQDEVQLVFEVNELVWEAPH